MSRGSIRRMVGRRSSAVEQGNHNPLVGGSNPPAATIPGRFVQFRSVSEIRDPPRIFVVLAVNPRQGAAERGAFYPLWSGAGLDADAIDTPRPDSTRRPRGVAFNPTGQKTAGGTPSPMPPGYWRFKGMDVAGGSLLPVGTYAPRRAEHVRTDERPQAGSPRECPFP